MEARFTIVGLGEALFDVFPDAQVLGGAPLNVAVHAHQLAQPVGGRGVVVSRIGQDNLGQQLIGELQARGLSVQYLQTDPDRDTGKVYVETGSDGEPSYDIVQNVAWDWLQFDPGDESLAARCEAVCFGTLAQRSGESRSAIHRFLTAARRALRFFDVNLRQNYFDQSILTRSCEMASVVKLNQRELKTVCNVLGLRPAPGEGGEVDRQIRALIKKFNLKLVALTRGEQGTALYTATDKIVGEPVQYPRAERADHVGAGDACAAGLLFGLVQRWPLEKTLRLANRMGAYVASQPGATPTLPADIAQLG